MKENKTIETKCFAWLPTYTVSRNSCGGHDLGRVIWFSSYIETWARGSVMNGCYGYVYPSEESWILQSRKAVVKV